MQFVRFRIYLPIRTGLHVSPKKTHIANGIGRSKTYIQAIELIYNPYPGLNIQLGESVLLVTPTTPLAPIYVIIFYILLSRVSKI